MQILLTGGCHGDASHFQPFDKGVDDSSLDPVALRRSVPHNRDDFRVKECWDLLGKDRRLHVVVTMRDFWCTAHSQVTNRHVRNLNEAYNHIEYAYKRIFQELWDYNIPYTPLVFESLVLNPVQVQRTLLAQLGLTVPSDDRLVPVRNENLKHWEEGRFGVGERRT